MISASATESLPLIMSRGAYDTTGIKKPDAPPQPPNEELSAGAQDTCTG